LQFWQTARKVCLHLQNKTFIFEKNARPHQNGTKNGLPTVGQNKQIQKRRI